MMAASAIVLASCLSPNTAELVDPQCRFPEGTKSSWSGRTSLRAMHINPPSMRTGDTPGAGPDDVAMVYITRDPVFLDLGPGSGATQFAPVLAYCAVYPRPPGGQDGDIAVVYGELPEGWKRP